MVFLRPDRFVAGACLNQHGPATLDAILAAMSFTGKPGDRARNIVPDDASSLLG